MSDLIGKTLGSYQILEQIGRGGMAVVYKGYQPSLDRYVAVKMLPAHLTHEPDFPTRFKREARAVAKLEHPNILAVYDYGHEENLSFIVMRYIEGGTLSDSMGMPLEMERIVKLIGQIADALDYAHENGVIHRDVKPSNVLLDRGDWPLLTDFGVARMLGATQQLTATGVGMGTPAYMSPEQGLGERVERQSDVYSLGVVLFEMLTGNLPYEAETPLAIVLKHIHDPLPIPSEVNPNIPEVVERVVLKAMAKAPDDRYQTAGELARALQAAAQEADTAKERSQVADGVLTQDVLAGVPRPAWTLARLGQFQWVIPAALLVVGAVVLLSRVPLRVQISGGQLEVVRVVEATPALSGAEGATLEVVLAATPKESEMMATATLIGRIVYASDKTGNGEIYVANSDDSGERRLTDDPASDWDPTWSPDGTRIVFASDRDAIREPNNKLYVMAADGSNLTRLTHTESNDLQSSWSPDGSRIAFHSSCNLAVINTDGSNWTTPIEWGEDLCVQLPTWSPDSQRIAFRSKIPPHGPGPYQQDIYIVNDDGSESLKLAAFTSEKYGGYVVWSPDGSRVAFDIILDGQQKYYAVNSDGSGEPVEIPSILDSWYPWYWPQWGGEEAPPLAATPKAPKKVVENLYADVDLACEGADDLSSPAGTVMLTPTIGGVRFKVELTNAAPNWPYYVEIQEDYCLIKEQYYGLTTDKNGNGVLIGTYTVPPGNHLILVDVVSDPPENVPDNPKHREIGMDAPVIITVP